MMFFLFLDLEGRVSTGDIYKVFKSGSGGETAYLPIAQEPSGNCHGGFIFFVDIALRPPGWR
jgi:hypothetical protein